MGSIAVPAVPRPRSGWDGVSPLPFERGTDDAAVVVHAARVTLDGTKSLCDGHVIEVRLGGRFDVTAAEACPYCSATIFRRH